jgi:predicted lactoylglutathione lyase
MRSERSNEEAIVATTQEALQVSTFLPIFTVDDLQKSMAFYEALGFAVDERWEENGTLLGVMLRAGKSQVGLNQDDWKKGRDRHKGIGLRLVISTTQNVDEIAARAKSAGLTLKSEPHDTDMQTRAFEVIDPSGFLLTIASETPA